MHASAKHGVDYNGDGVLEVNDGVLELLDALSGAGLGGGITHARTVARTRIPVRPSVSGEQA